MRRLANYWIWQTTCPEPYSQPSTPKSAIIPQRISRDQVTSVPMVFVGRRGTLVYPARLTSRVTSHDTEEEEGEGLQTARGFAPTLTVWLSLPVPDNWTLARKEALIWQMCGMAKEESRSQTTSREQGRPSSHALLRNSSIVPRYAKGGCTAYKLDCHS